MEVHLKVHRKRFARRGGALIAVAGTGALVALGSAGAYVGGSFSGPLPTSNAPDLRSATIIRTVHPTDSLGGQAKFCFDQALNSNVVTGGFYLNDHDSARGHNGVGTATPDPQHPECVTINFANGEDISQATTGVAETGAVHDVGGAPNPVASVPLTGSTLAQNLTTGRTDGPELIGATPDVSNKQITYTFDENLRPNNPAYMNPANFGFYINTSNGAAPITANGGSIVNTTDNNVVVQFPAGVTNMGSAQQYEVLPGAVQDVAQNFGPSGGTPTSGGSVGTQINGSPGLDGAAMNGDHQTVNLHFTQGVNPGSATSVGLFREDGSLANVLVANTISTTNDVNNQTLQATFGTDAQSDNVSLTRVVVLPGAATARSGGNGVTVGGAGTGNVGSFTPGFSDGPDLVYTDIDDATNRAIFHYDEPVKSNPPPTPTNFFLFGPDGVPIAGQSGVVLSDSNKAVSVHFGSSVSATVGVANFFSAVVDETAENNASQEASVGVGPAGCQPGSCPATPTPTATPSVTPTPTTTPKQHAKTTISAKHKKSSSKVTGKVGSSAAACKGGRSLTLKKGSKTIASGKSKSSGAFTLKSSKAKGAGKGKLKVTAKSRTIGNLICDAASKKV